MNLQVETMIAEGLVTDACKLAGQLKFAERIGIVWSNRATTRLGLASRATFTITLSRKAWALIGNDEQRETIFHEIAHLIAYYEGGLPSWGHTPQWRAVMGRIGYPSAERCYTLTAALEPLRRRVKRVVASCGCAYSIPGGTHRAYNGDHFITVNKARRMQAGEKFVCRSCGDVLELTCQVIVI